MLRDCEGGDPTSHTRTPPCPHPRAHTGAPCAHITGVIASHTPTGALSRARDTRAPGIHRRRACSLAARLGPGPWCRDAPGRPLAGPPRAYRASGGATIRTRPRNAPRGPPSVSAMPSAIGPSWAHRAFSTPIARPRAIPCGLSWDQTPMHDRASYRDTSPPCGKPTDW